MNKKIKNIITIVLALITTGGVTSNTIKVKASTSNTIGTREIKTENPIKVCDNYVIYYGYQFSSAIIEKLKTYNLVIINPLEEGANDARKKLQAAGVKVYAYSSSVEIPSYDTELLDSINEDEKLKINDITLTHWESNELGDLRQLSYRNKIISQITNRISSIGYDGVFIDTLDDLENMSDILKENNVKVSSTDAYVLEMEVAGIDFLKELKNANPNLSIIQNRGFQLLDKGAGGLVDAVLYEDICRSADIDYYNSIKAILDKYTLNNNGVVMALANQNKYYVESKKISQENKWLYYQTKNYETTSIVDGSSYKIDINGSDVVK